MKTKTLINIGAISVVPVMIFALVFGAVGIAYLADPQANQIIMLIAAGKANNIFLMILSIAGVLGCSIILTTMLFITRYADKIDQLDEHIAAYFKARQKYEKATTEFVKNQNI